MPQDATVTGGLGLVAMALGRHSRLWEPPAEARDPAPWSQARAGALTPLKGPMRQATRDAAPGLLASVAPPLGGQHAPAVCQGPPARSPAGSAPRAAPQRAATQARAKAAERRTRMPALHTSHTAPAKRRPGRPPQVAARHEPAACEVAAARHAPHRLMGPRATVRHRLRAIGPAYHWVAVDRGGRRHGQRRAGESQPPSAALRPRAHQAPLSATCLERLAQAARGGPTMPAPMACVAGSVRPHGTALELAPPQSCALPAPLLPAPSRARVAATTRGRAGAPRRARAERLRTALLEPGGGGGRGLRESKAGAHSRRPSAPRSSRAPAPTGQGATESAPCGLSHGADAPPQPAGLSDREAPRLPHAS